MDEDLQTMDILADVATLQDCDSIQKHSAQLQVVHQAFRKMERNKRHYHIDTEGTLRRQQALLDNLKSDNSALQETVDTYEIKDYNQQMAHLLEEANMYSSMIEIETNKLNDLEAAISETSVKELESKKAMGGYEAGWAKHRATQIHLQQAENRLQKTNVDLNVLQSHKNLLKGKMAQLRQEQAFYSNIYQKLNRELQAWEEDIQQCIDNMNGMYSDRNEYQDEISDLHEMAENKHNYQQWLNMEGWTTQEPISLTELASSQLSGTEMDNFEAVSQKHSLEDTRKKDNMSKLKQPVRQGVRKITKTHYAKRRKGGDHYRKWVEIKAFGNTQDLLKVENIFGVLPSIIEARKKGAELCKNMTELLKEMDGLDMVKQDHIFDLTGSENTDSKSSVAGGKYEIDKTVEYLIDSVRHLDIDDEAFLPIVIDMKRQILLIFKEAGCYIKDEVLGIEDEAGNAQNVGKVSENRPPELTIGRLFSGLEDFVDRISGTFS